MAPVLQVVVEAHGHRVGVVAADHDLAAFTAEREIVAGIGRQGLEYEMPGLGRDDALCQGFGGQGIGALVFLCTAAGKQQDEGNRQDGEVFHNRMRKLS